MLKTDLNFTAIEGGWVLALHSLFLAHGIKVVNPGLIIINNTHLWFFESFHPFVNFPLAHTIIIILICHLSLNFTSFHIF